VLSFILRSILGIPNADRAPASPRHRVDVLCEGNKSQTKERKARDEPMTMVLDLLAATNES